MSLTVKERLPLRIKMDKQINSHCIYQALSLGKLLAISAVQSIRISSFHKNFQKPL